MELFCRKSDCCGCSACMSICPKNAITMEADEEGFLYPKIKESLCISCGLCNQVCAFQNGYDTKNNFTIPYGYAAKHKSEEIRANSRSGGMFTALTDYILNQQGIVVGAGYGKEFEVMHKCATTKEERNELRGSKYVQSNMTNMFLEVKKYLEDHRYVLFSGTACQTAGLRQFLKKDYEKLYLVDIICHGTPSPSIWRDFLKLRSKEYRGKITQVNFRDKGEFGWKAHYETVVIRKKKYSSRVYTKLFYLNAVLRPSCYYCRYTNLNRPSDITLADFWGHEKAVPGFCEDDKGISLVLLNTDKGKKLFDLTCQDMDLIDCTGYNYRNTNLKKSSDQPDNREEFWEDYRKKGFRYVAEKYTKYRYRPYHLYLLNRLCEKSTILHTLKKKLKNKIR